jgi:hypothetical protein
MCGFNLSTDVVLLGVSRLMNPVTEDEIRALERYRGGVFEEAEQDGRGCSGWATAGLGCDDPGGTWLDGRSTEEQRKIIPSSHYRWGGSLDQVVNRTGEGLLVRILSEAIGPRPRWSRSIRSGKHAAL